jgi:hypothetical protein
MQLDQNAPQGSNRTAAVQPIDDIGELLNLLC